MCNGNGEKKKETLIIRKTSLCENSGRFITRVIFKGEPKSQVTTKNEIGLQCHYRGFTTKKG